MDDPRVPYIVDRDHSDPRALKATTERLLAEGHQVLTDPEGTLTEFLTADDAEQLLGDRTFAAPAAMAMLAFSGVNDGPLDRLWSQLMFSQDGPAHQRLRRAVSSRFTPRAVEALRPQVERFSDDLLSAVDPSAAIDLWGAYAVPLSARSACAVVGVPDEDASTIAALALHVVRAFGLMSDPAMVSETERAAAQMLDHLERTIDGGRVVPGSVLDDLLSGPSHDLTPPEVRSLAANLMFGGLDATAKALTTAVVVFAEQRDAWADLVADPGAVAPGAVGECLRLNPPVFAVTRLCRKDADIGGTPVRASQALLANLDAICRDPRLFDRPDEFDVHRGVGRHYAFGAGDHYCLGAGLARLVLEVALRDLAVRFPRMALTQDPDTLPWTADPFRGPVSLPVVLEPAG